MNKKLLATLIIPLLGMTACGNNDLKEVTYFADSQNGTVVSEKGYKKTVYVVATYDVPEEVKEPIAQNYYANFPASLNLAMSFTRGAEAEALPAELPASVKIGGTMYYLKLNKATVSYYETYSDVFYNEGKRVAKFVKHEDVKTAESTSDYSTAYVLSFPSDSLTIEKNDKETPCKDWTIRRPVHVFEEKTSERLVQYAEQEIVYYTFK